MTRAVLLAAVFALGCFNEGARAQGAATYEEAPAALTVETTVQARIRREADPSAPVVDVLPSGTAIEADARVQSAGRRWYRVARKGKAIGYVQADQVKERTAAGAPPRSANPAMEALFWDSIKDSRNPKDYRAYLDKYPNGVFTDLASRREAEYAQARPAAAQPGPYEPKALTDPEARQQIAAAIAAGLRDWPFDGDWKGKIRRTELNIDWMRHNCPDATMEFTVLNGQIAYGKLNVIGINITFATPDQPGAAVSALGDLAKTASKFGRLALEGQMGKDGSVTGVKVRAYDFVGTNFVNYTLTGRADGNGLDGRWVADLNACSGNFSFGRADGSALVPQKKN